MYWLYYDWLSHFTKKYKLCNVIKITPLSNFLSILFSNRWNLITTDIPENFVHTQFDIYILITITSLIPLLLDYYSPRVSPAQ